MVKLNSEKIRNGNLQQSGNCRIFEKRTIQPEISEIVGGKSVIRGKKFPKISAFLARFSSVLEIPENAVPFVTRNFRKFKPEFFIKLKVPP